MARTPRAPTARERNIIRARQQAVQAAVPRERATVRTPRAPRKPTARERNVERSRNRVRTIRSEVERKTPDVQSERAVERYTRSPAFKEALESAHLSGQIHALQSKLKGPSYARAETKWTGVPGFRKKVTTTRRAGDAIKADLSRTLPKGVKDPLGNVIGATAYGTKGKSREQLEQTLRRLRALELETGPKGGKEYEKQRSKTLKRMKREDLAMSSAKRMSSGEARAARGLLEFTLRPTHAIAGAASEVAKGHSPAKAAKAAKEGITGKGKKTWSDVLREHGMKTGAGALGFGLDVATDPLTYVTFGVGSVERKLAIKAAQDAAKSASKVAMEAALAREGVTRAEARAIGRHRGAQAAETAFRKALEKNRRQGPRHHQGSGIDLRIAGKSVPGVTRATSFARAGTARRVRPVTHSRAGTATRKIVRQLGSEAHAGVRKQGQSKAEQHAVKALQRETRAASERVSRHANARVNALLGRLAPHERDMVIDAIEMGGAKSRSKGALGVRSLKGAAQPIKARKTLNLREYARRRKDVKDPDRLYTVARRVEDDLKFMLRTGQRSGLLGTGIGKQARKRSRSTVNATRQGIRSRGPVYAALKVAGQDLVKARVRLRNLPADTKPSVRFAARRDVRHASERFENLRRQLVGIHEAELGRNVRETVNRRTDEQMRKEARGYVPRTRQEAVEQGGVLSKISEGLHDVPVVREQVGANKPSVGAAAQREHRETRAQMRQTELGRAKLAGVSSDLPAVLAQYGASIGRASAARQMNTRIIQEFGEKIPRNPSKAQIQEWANQGKSVYRVRRGQLERIDPSSSGLIKVASQRARVQEHPRINPKTGRRYEPVPQSKIKIDPKTGKPERPGAVESGGQYALLDDALVARIRDRQPDIGSKSGIMRGYDAAQAGFKRLALSTPGYLVRNFFGDAYNAWGDEAFWRLARNTLKGQKVLNALGRYEKALQRFDREIPDKLKTVKLTETQAEQIARAIGVKPGEVSRNVNAKAIALLAERMGVIRQGRFLELMSEGAKLTKPRSMKGWDNSVKRVEDSVRIATFLGGLQRGLNPKEAATRASKIHFDYGDLTGFEKGISRRAMPFYTFTSRNIPLQAERIVSRPGKLATLSKAQEEARKSAGLKPDFREGQSEYEARQMGFPIRIGNRVHTVSIGSPFVDLNDIVQGAKSPVQAVKTTTQRVGEMTSPLLKTSPELTYNLSLFFRDQITPETEPLTRAPQWAIEMGKGKDPASKAFAKATGLRPDYEPPEGGPVWGWARGADYASKQLPGVLGYATKTGPLGVQKGQNARGMKPWQTAAAFAGPRIIEYEKGSARIEQIRQQEAPLLKRKALLNRVSNPKGGGRINDDNPTPEYTKLMEAISRLEEEKVALQKQQRPGGYVAGERVPIPGQQGATRPLTSGQRARMERARQRGSRGLTSGQRARMERARQRAARR